MKLPICLYDIAGNIQKGTKCPKIGENTGMVKMIRSSRQFLWMKTTEMVTTTVKIGTKKTNGQNYWGKQ